MSRWCWSWSAPPPRTSPRFWCGAASHDRPVGTAATVQKLMLLLHSDQRAVLRIDLPARRAASTGSRATCGRSASSSTSTSSTRMFPRRPARSANSVRRLAPKPGQKPVRDRRTITDTPAEVVDDDVTTRGGVRGRRERVAPRSSTPRPGARPNRGSGADRRAVSGPVRPRSGVS